MTDRRWPRWSGAADDAVADLPQALRQRRLGGLRLGSRGVRAVPGGELGGSRRPYLPDGP